MKLPIQSARRDPDDSIYSDYYDDNSNPIFTEKICEQINNAAAGPWKEGLPPKETPDDKWLITEYVWQGQTLFYLGKYKRLGLNNIIRYAELKPRAAKK